MQYMLLIYSGDAPEKWDSLSEDEQNAIMGEYFAISRVPGSHRRRASSSRRDGDDRAGARTARR